MEFPPKHTDFPVSSASPINWDNWYEVLTGSQSTFQQPPQPQTPPAAAPPPQPEVPPAAAPAAPTVLTITVPEGVMAGQQIQIKAPTGQLVNVKVPEGCGPGSQFKIQI